MRLGYTPMNANVLDLDAAFRLAEELGLEFVELVHDLHEVMPQLQHPERVRDLMRATGVGTTVHLSYVDLNLASLMPKARATAVDRTLAGLAYAAEVDAVCGVLHTGQHYLRRPEADALAAQALAASLDALRGSTVPIVLENLALDDEGYVRSADHLRDLVDRHGTGACFDIGHAHIQGTREGRDEIAALLTTLGSRITHLHLHDNHGRHDEHVAIGRGTIDYLRHTEFLRDFTGTVCLEIGPDAAAVREGVARLRALAEAGA